MDTGELGYQAIALGFDRVDQVGFVNGGEHPVDGADQIALTAIAKEVVEREGELRTVAPVFGNGAFDRVPGRVAMAVDVVAGDPVRDALEAEAHHQPVVEGRGVTALDRPAETSRSCLLYTSD